MDESTIFAMSVARAVEADAALIEELRLEDQIARDRMMAETLETDPEATIEPYQFAIDEETFETLRHFNVITTSNAEETDSGEERTTDGTQNDQEAQQIQLAAHTDDIQEDTVVDHDTSDDTSGDNQIVNDWKTPDLENDAQGTNTVQDWAWWTVFESANEQQEPDDPGEVLILEQEWDTAQNVLTAVEDSAASAQPTDIALAPELKQCVSCQDDLPATETFEAPCSHHWCQSCLALCFESSFRNKSRFPPRCCEALPVEVGDFITQEMVDNFKKKEVEFSTENPTYCSDATCAAFIPPQSIEGGIGRCHECEKQTCVLCKQPLHEGICPEDSASQEVLRLGEAEGWQRCEECKHLIDLKIGCFHISEYISSPQTRL
ncbi:hypothetical protein HYE68_003057 [Fusarium pseudograminearum]|nr:hypothetical protein HYE68_003057 [Fusarium pseudograminearum]